VVRILALLVLCVSTVDAKEVRTKFNPTKHGFNFGNDFNNDFIKKLDIRTGGLCGGMVYSALDYFNARKPIPRQDYRPANRTPLQSYIYNRQVNSLKGLEKWVEVGFNPFGARNSEFFRWGLQGFNGGRLQELRSYLDKGKPVVLGLWGVDGGKHQVLAIGYDVGRYKGRFGKHQEDFKIFIYDPNYQNQVVTLRPDTKNNWYYYEGRDKKWRTYFVDTKYTKKVPKVGHLPKYPKDKKIHELVLHFDIGNDDLRGGNDNLNVTVNLANGSQQKFRAVNLRARWLENYSESARIVLKKPVKAEQIMSIDLDATFRGGVGGDNFNIKSVYIDGRGGPGALTKTKLIHYKKKFRFTGKKKNLHIKIRNPRKAKVGQVSKLRLKMRTGNDDLRGGNDNLNVIVELKNGRRQLVKNVNRSRGWRKGSTHVVEVRLTNPVHISQLKGVRLATTFGGGIGGDNWNLAELSIEGIGPKKKKLYAKKGRPLNRFTGDKKSFLAKFKAKTLAPSKKWPARKRIRPVLTKRKKPLLKKPLRKKRSKPSIRGERLAFQITTGGDDLRGGKDNLNLTITFKNGKRQTLKNANRGRRWKDNSTNTVSLRLNQPVKNVKAVEFRTTFRGGMGGDNWNMKRLQVLNLDSRKSLYKRSGKPLKRFTGDKKSFRFKL